MPQKIETAHRLELARSQASAECDTEKLRNCQLLVRCLELPPSLVLYPHVDGETEAQNMADLRDPSSMRIGGLN